MEAGKPPPLTDEQIAQNAKTKKISAALMLVTAVYLAVSGGLCLSGTINLAGRTTYLANFGERLEFTAKYQILGVLWLQLLIFNVIYKRVTLGAINPLEDAKGIGMYFKKQSNILQNSFEQFIISAFAQICLVAFISGEYTLRTIPWINFTFLIGRIAFYFGYPTYRTFGVMLSIITSTGIIGVTTYKLLEHLFW